MTVRGNLDRDGPRGIGSSKTLFTFTGGAAWANTENSGHMTRIIGASTFVADAASTSTPQIVVERLRRKRAHSAVAARH